MRASGKQRVYMTSLMFLQSRSGGRLWTELPIGVNGPYAGMIIPHIVNNAGHCYMKGVKPTLPLMQRMISPGPGGKPPGCPSIGTAGSIGTTSLPDYNQRIGFTISLIRPVELSACCIRGDI